MPTEHGEGQLGGLRREHLVAAAMVAAVTVVLGFASGLGVWESGVADAAPVSPPGAVAAPPGAPQGPPAGAAAAGTGRPGGGSQVGIRPGSQSAAANGSGSVSGSGSALGSGSDAGSGGVPGHSPAAGVGPAGTPTEAAPGVPAQPQCPAGVLDQLLALITQVLGGGAPAEALSASGAVTPAPQSPADLVYGAAGLYTLLPIGDRMVPVVGLVPLLDAVDQRQDARRAESTSPLMVQPAAVPAEAGPPTPADQLALLAALLSPLGLVVDPISGLTDPLLVPVLGSLGCTGFVPAPPQQLAPQETLR